MVTDKQKSSAPVASANDPGLDHDSPRFEPPDFEDVTMTETNEILVVKLGNLSIEYVFGYPGGQVIELFDALSETDIDVVRSCDERERSDMAEMYGCLIQNSGVRAGQGPWLGSLGTIGQMEARLSS